MRQIGGAVAGTVTGVLKWPPNAILGTYNGFAIAAGFVNSGVDWGLREMGVPFQFGSPPLIPQNRFIPTNQAEASAAIAMDVVTVVPAAIAAAPRILAWGASTSRAARVLVGSAKVAWEVRAARAAQAAEQAAELRAARDAARFAEQWSAAQRAQKAWEAGRAMDTGWMTMFAQDWATRWAELQAVKQAQAAGASLMDAVEAGRAASTAELLKLAEAERLGGHRGLFAEAARAEEAYRLGRTGAAVDTGEVGKAAETAKMGYAVDPNAADLYARLGVPRTATPQEIKDAFRDYARLKHPDVVTDAEKAAATAKFQKVNEAYQALKDPAKRATYDAAGGARTSSSGISFEDFLHRTARSRY
jgi:hypothetical protein